MESRFKVLGHAAHPILIVFPLGLLATSVVFDLIYLWRGTPQWSSVSFWLIAVGVVTGLIAAMPGLVDFLAIPSGTRAKSVGLLHGAGNVLVVILFAVSWLIRRDAGHGFEMAAPPTTLALICSFVGVGIALVTGWLGGELIERLGVSVYSGANLDAPSSLSGQPASPDAKKT